MVSILTMIKSRMYLRAQILTPLITNTIAKCFIEIENNFKFRELPTQSLFENLERRGIRNEGDRPALLSELETLLKLERNIKHSYFVVYGSVIIKQFNNHHNDIHIESKMLRVEYEMNL